MRKDSSTWPTHKKHEPSIQRLFEVVVLAALVLQACRIDPALRSPVGSASTEISVVRFPDSADDTARVTIDVVDAGGFPTYISGRLLAGEGDTYLGTLTGLPLDIPLRFLAHAYDSGGRQTHIGWTAAALSSGESFLMLILEPVDDGQPVDFPVIRRISPTGNSQAGTAATVTLQLTAGPHSPLGFSITPGGLFSPSSGTVIMNAEGEGTVAVTCSAPAAPGTCSATARVVDRQGRSVERDFDVCLQDNPTPAGLSLTSAPEVSALRAKRVGGEAAWAAAVVDDGPAAELVYSWSLDGIEFSTENPGVLSGYTEFLSGTITLVMTDTFGLGGRTSVRFPLAAGQFPADPGSPTPGRGYDLYLLLGQSNMVGRTPISADPDQVPHPRVFELARARRWVPAADPLEHNDLLVIGVGPGLSFGKTMAADDPDVQVALIPAARGGTSITRWKRGGELYNDAVARALGAVAAGDGRIRGILWHQGEADALRLADAEAYAGRLSTLIRHLREDLGVPDLPFVCGTLYPGLPASYAYADLINAALTGLPSRVAKTYCASSDGLSDTGDDLHFDAPSQRELGWRMAQGMIDFLR